jgi:hypothetical protein
MRASFEKLNGGRHRRDAGATGRARHESAPYSRPAQFRPGRHTDLHALHAVVQREVDAVLPLPRRYPADHLGLVIGQVDRARYPQPAPGVLPADVQVNSAHAGGGHVVHGEALAADRPARGDLRRVGDKARPHAGGILRQRPDGLGHHALRPRRETVVGMSGVRPALALQAEVEQVIPEQVGIRVGYRQVGIELLCGRELVHENRSLIWGGTGAILGRIKMAPVPCLPPTGKGSTGDRHGFQTAKTAPVPIFRRTRYP